MARPIKRLCLQSTGQRFAPSRKVRKTNPLRAISSTTPRTATEVTTTNEAADDAYLDQLANQPGVKYSTTEDDEGLSRVNIGDLSSMAHRELEQHREVREMVRLAAWEMPLLSQLSKPFERPRKEQMLRWRYTTYMGEAHPASRKVVVEFLPKQLPLTLQQCKKLCKLAGPRYNPSTGSVKMSCESFETQAQNKRYLADTITKLIAECENADADAFEDVPLDTRHHQSRKVLRFPEAWRLTPERKAELEAKRRASMLEDGRRVEENKLVSGVSAIEEARKLLEERAKETVTVEAGQPLAKGRLGRKEVGQQQRRG